MSNGVSFTLQVNYGGLLWTVCGAWQPPKEASFYDEGMGWIVVDEIYPFDSASSVKGVLSTSAVDGIEERAWRGLVNGR